MTKNIPEIRCIHRHTIEEHPSCFAQGKVRYNFFDDREWERKTGLPWYQYPDYKIGYLDIEADGLKANFATMLSWAVKDKGGDTTYDVISKEELFNGTIDRRIVKSLLDTLQDYKIICTYYGTNYDIKFIRTKALFYGLDFPGYSPEINSKGNYVYRSEVYHFDLYYVVRGTMLLHSNRLEVATKYLGIEGKTPLSPDVWRRAKYGDPEALEKVVEHNVADVEILEDLHDRLTPFRKWTRKGL